ncbi:ABC transporter ATP-binding protein [Halostella sp. JP-L12]|uniref:ABC transporter ATP-binding protein n=1 Tax=Halostella TaxID=1843185 RepID=UPI000EF83663|nr:MULTISPECIES: ABC transporter ATP-binding protein [Halostella]NHN49919.1 ABC transporter ATP-binding protein [Halostella sp. JP-L12]
MDALVADDVEKRYGETAALRGVSLSVAEGEVFALVGPNGAGKTTLVRALTGTTRPDAGEASVFGESPAAVDESRLGVLPQSFSPPARLTARELVDYYAGLYDDARATDDVLETVGMVDDADAWYENLSGGQQRRTCLGVALVNDPDALFLDEPTTGIDPAGRRTVQEQIGDLAAGGATVFLTTHDMTEAERVADRVGFLADGELVAVGTPTDLVREHGGERRLVIATDAGADALSGIDFRTESRDGELVVRGVEPADIGGVVRALDEAGVGYSELTWTQPDLEDVYLELTGDRYARRPGAAPAEAASGTRAEAATDREAAAETGGER